MRTYARFANAIAFWSQTLEKIQIKGRRKNVLVSFFKSELSALTQTPFCDLFVASDADGNCTSLIKTECFDLADDLWYSYSCGTGRDADDRETI